MIWSQPELLTDQAALFYDFLAVLGYLGRAEHWIEAEQITEAPSGPIHAVERMTPMVILPYMFFSPQPP